MLGDWARAYLNPNDYALLLLAKDGRRDLLSPELVAAGDRLGLLRWRLQQHLDGGAVTGWFRGFPPADTIRVPPREAGWRTCASFSVHTIWYRERDWTGVQVREDDERVERQLSGVRKGKRSL